MPKKTRTVSELVATINPHPPEMLKIQLKQVLDEIHDHAVEMALKFAPKLTDEERERLKRSFRRVEASEPE